MFIGAHISIAKGFPAAVKTAVKMKANTLQFFTRNPRGGNARQLRDEEIAEADILLKEHRFGPLVAHSPYTFNLASAKENVREFTIRTLKDDLLRVSALGVPNLVLHVGTHGGQGLEKGTELVISGLEEVLPKLAPGVFLLLEVMAGEGTEIGYTFEQLAEIIAGCGNHPGLGVCLDSCHLTGAGYDLRDFARVKEEFQKILGWERLRAFHLNDSQYPLGSGRDRHARLGEGTIGLEPIKSIVSDPDMQEIPLILETPNDEAGYAREIEIIKKLAAN